MCCQIVGAGAGSGMDIQDDNQKKLKIVENGEPEIIQMFDLNLGPKDIEDLVLYRPPRRFVDYLHSIVHYNDGTWQIYGDFKVKMEHCFGHFEGNSNGGLFVWPVFMGVQLIEALFQLGGIALKYLSKIGQIKTEAILGVVTGTPLSSFKEPIYPGDRIYLQCIIQKAGSRIITFSNGKIFVMRDDESKVAAETYAIDKYPETGQWKVLLMKGPKK